MKHFHAISWAALASMSGVSSNVVAAPIATKAVTHFDYHWDFDQATAADSLDRYNNATGAAVPDALNDFDKNAGVTGISVTGGLLTIGNVALDNLVWRTAPGIDAVSGYTLETRLRVVTSSGRGMAIVFSPTAATTGAPGAPAIAVGHVTGENGTTTNVYWSTTADPVASAAQFKAARPSDAFVNLRIAAEPSTSLVGGLVYALYVDGALVDDGLARSLASTYDRLILGKIGSLNAGTIEIDHLAFTSGAFAPVVVPEPASATALTVATVAGLLRRRSHRARLGVASL